jgi:rsbT co-antagonist protein RsbR
LRISDRLLIIPVIGSLESARALKLNEQLLNAVRDTRAKVAIIDITGVSAMDSHVANNLIQTVGASKLMGATVIITGLSSDIAQTLVNIDVNLNGIQTAGDLQAAMGLAENFLQNGAPDPGQRS